MRANDPNLPHLCLIAEALFDLMPVQADVLGFTNRWYPYAVKTAEPATLTNGITINLVSAVAFVATKLEAFASRGANDFFSSHDLEDVLNIVDGREELVEEIMAAPSELKQYVAGVFAALLANRDFLNALPGLIAEPERAHVVAARLERMCM
jgi:predicted nucleotidyltransferase